MSVLLLVCAKMVGKRRGAGPYESISLVIGSVQTKQMCHGLSVDAVVGEYGVGFLFVWVDIVVNPRLNCALYR